MASGFIRHRVVQVHPSLRCNLNCAHCYSSSGPRARAEIGLRALVDRLTRLRAEGYEVVSFSGGEPLLYPAFDEAVDEAVALGFRVNLVSNGLLWTAQRAARLAGRVSLVGLSLDGAPARHDQMRGKAGAFERLLRRLPVLRDWGIRYALAHCVTRNSIEDLPWLLEFAVEQGAAALQIHPLTLLGRGVACASMALTQAELARVFLIVELLRSEAGSTAIQLDLVATRDALARQGDYAALGPTPAGLPLSALINPIVIDEAGALWPLAYGMAPALRLDADDDGWAAVERVRASGAATLRGLLQGALNELERTRPRFVDWYGFVTAFSHEWARGDAWRGVDLELSSSPRPAGVRSLPTIG